MDERERLSISNKLMILLTVILSSLFIVSLVFLVFSLKDEPESIPELNVNYGKTSTSYIVTTAPETTTTEPTTTTRVLASPYYDMDVDKLLNNELMKKKDLTREEAIELITYFYKIVDQIYNINNNSFLDIKTIMDYAKEGEIDSVMLDDHRYGLIYNADYMFEKLFTGSSKNDLLSLKYEDTSIFKINDKKYYRIGDIKNNSSMEFVSINLEYNRSEKIVSSIKYYDKNYKDKGFTAPQYKTFKLELYYMDGNWKISYCKYPMYG